MTMGWIIQKRTRAVERPTTLNAYRNPETCRKAGVVPGHIYDTKWEAERDARKLAQFNGVGFVVSPV